MLGLSDAKGASDAMEHLRRVSLDSLRCEGDQSTDTLDQALRALVLQGVEQAQALDRRAESTSRTAKGGDEFTFDHFVRGLQGIIGVPDGLIEEQGFRPRDAHKNSRIILCINVKMSIIHFDRSSVCVKKGSCPQAGDCEARALRCGQGER